MKSATGKKPSSLTGSPTQPGQENAYTRGGKQCQVVGCERPRLWSADSCSYHLFEDHVAPFQVSTKWRAWIRQVADTRTITEANLDNAHIYGYASGVVPIRFEKHVIERSSARNTVFMGRFDGSRFVDCSLEGSSFAGCSLTRVEFRNCNLDRVTFSSCDLAYARITGVTISEARFCEDSRLHHARLENLEFFACALQGLDLSRAVIRDLRINGKCDLRGLKLHCRQKSEIKFDDEALESLGANEIVYVSSRSRLLIVLTKISIAIQPIQILERVLLIVLASTLLTALPLLREGWHPTSLSEGALWIAYLSLSGTAIAAVLHSRTVWSRLRTAFRRAEVSVY